VKWHNGSHITSAGTVVRQTGRRETEQESSTAHKIAPWGERRAASLNWSRTKRRLRPHGRSAQMREACCGAGHTNTILIDEGLQTNSFRVDYGREERSRDLTGERLIAGRLTQCSRIERPRTHDLGDPGTPFDPAVRCPNPERHAQSPSPNTQRDSVRVRWCDLDLCAPPIEDHGMVLRATRS